MKQRVSVYLDIYVNKNIMSSLHVRAKLVQFGSICKDPELLEDGIHVLGLDVHGE